MQQFPKNQENPTWYKHYNFYSNSVTVGIPSILVRPKVRARPCERRARSLARGLARRRHACKHAHAQQTESLAKARRTKCTYGHRTLDDEMTRKLSPTWGASAHRPTIGPSTSGFCAVCAGSSLPGSLRRSVSSCESSCE